MTLAQRPHSGGGAEAPAAAEPPEPGSRRKALILGTLCITLFMAMLDGITV